MAFATRTWTLLVCPICGHSEGLDIYDEVLFCGHGDEPVVMQAVEVISIDSPHVQAGVRAQLEVERLRAALKRIADFDDPGCRLNTDAKLFAQWAAEALSADSVSEGN
jgi:hypothetical protein